MAKLPPFPGTTGKRDWRTAFDAIRKLLANGDDTTQVFRIMRALNVGNAPMNYARFIATEEGGRMAYERAELAQVFSQPGYADQFAPGTVGAAYADFLRSTGYSADGLVEVSRLEEADPVDEAHPYLWMGRRIRDSHDIWHVLTGYSANEPGGEAGLVAFSYAQTGGLGWAAIALAAALRGIAAFKSLEVPAMIWEGYRNGRHAKWLLAEDYEALFAEPIAAARARLRIRTPGRYFALRERMADFLRAQPAMAVAAE